MATLQRVRIHAHQVNIVSLGICLQQSFSLA